jgi:hypothetical protein
LRFPTVMTAAGDTSEPVPAVVGTPIRRTVWVSVGNRATRLRGSRNGSANSARSRSGCSWNSRMALAASSTEPPPTAITVSGWICRIIATPAAMTLRSGSGVTPENTLTSAPSSFARTAATGPADSRTASVTMSTRCIGMVSRLSSAPTLKKVVEGTRNHCGVLLRNDTVFTFIRFR